MRRREMWIPLGLCGLPAAWRVAQAAEPISNAALPTWFIFLEAGRKTPDDKAAVQAMQRGHIANFKRLFALGLLMSAGPLRDPSGFKRGIVTVRAATREDVQSYFQPDDYVREGYMNVNAVPATACKALNTEGIDDTRIEEVRIVQITRGNAPTNLATLNARLALLQGLVDAGTVGAWYTLHSGPVAEVLFARTRDTPALEAVFAAYPGAGVGGVSVAVWAQWISPGVVR
jgi:uncharacterized protein YciI